MRYLSCLSLIALLGIAPLTFAAADTPLSTIAFGSCVKEDLPQPIWGPINKTNPDAFIFLGDNIYGDSEDMAVLRKKWNMLGAQPGYQELKVQATILATWDDHDFGVNDGGREYPKRVESQKEFLDFFEEPADTPRRKQEGIYDAKVFGPEGQRVQVILLDTRYHRSPLKKRTKMTHQAEGHNGGAAPDFSHDATILGKVQWTWLEEQLKVPAELRIVATSIQLIPDGHHYEKWGNFPLERERFFQLVKATRANGVILLSGDRHSSEISRMDAGVGYPLHEVTASALNRPNSWHNEINPYRLGVKYVDENFGIITIDWEDDDPEVSLQIRDIDGEKRMLVNTTVAKLKP